MADTDDAGVVLAVGEEATADADDDDAGLVSFVSKPATDLLLMILALFRLLMAPVRADADDPSDG